MANELCPNCSRDIIKDGHDPSTCCRSHGLPLTDSRDGRRVCRDCWRADPEPNECCGLDKPYHSHICENQTAPRAPRLIGGRHART